MTAGFKTKVQVELGDDGQWILTAPLCWEGSDGDRVTVPKGAKTDFASVPQLLQWLLPSAAPYVVRAAIVHDELCNRLKDYWEEPFRYIYKYGLYRPAFSSVDTDAIFEKIMRDEGASWLTQRVGWVGVRWGAAWSVYRRQGWLNTAPRVLGLSAAFLSVTLAILALIAKVVPW